MIFVAFGTQDFQFNRLAGYVDRLIGEKIINEYVYAQTGYSTYKAGHFEFKKFMSFDEFNKYLMECRILITHAGTGTITSALKLHKKVVVVPRLKKYNEHVDDHQVEITGAFSELGMIKCANDYNELKNIIQNIEDFNPNEFPGGRGEINGIISRFITDSFYKAL